MKVWTRIENPQTLLHQRLWVFTCNILYTVFYARSSKVSASNGLTGFRESLHHKYC